MEAERTKKQKDAAIVHKALASFHQPAIGHSSMGGNHGNNDSGKRGNGWDGNNGSKGSKTDSGKGIPSQVYKAGGKKGSGNNGGKGYNGHNDGSWSSWKPNNEWHQQDWQGGKDWGMSTSDLSSMSNDADNGGKGPQGTKEPCPWGEKWEIWEAQEKWVNDLRKYQKTVTSPYMEDLEYQHCIHFRDVGLIRMRLNIYDGLYPDEQLAELVTMGRLVKRVGRQQDMAIGERAAESALLKAQAMILPIASAVESKLMLLDDKLKDVTDIVTKMATNYQKQSDTVVESKLNRLDERLTTVTDMVARVTTSFGGTLTSLDRKLEKFPAQIQEGVTDAVRETCWTHLQM